MNHNAFANKQSARLPVDFEASLLDLFDQTSDLIIGTTIDAKVDFFNRISLDALGYDESELYGRSLFDLVAPTSRDEVRKFFEGIVAGAPQLETLETVFVSRNGSELQVEGHFRCRREASRKPVAVTAAFRNVTRSRRENKILEAIARGESESQILASLTQLIESEAPDVIASILILEDDKRTLRHGSAPNLPAGYIKAINGLQICDPGGSCGTAAVRGEPVFVDDIATDPLWVDYREIALIHGLAACWSTPIKDTQGNVLGTFAVYRREPGPCNAHQRRLIEISTHLASLVIGHNRAREDLNASEEKFAVAFRNSQHSLVLGSLEGNIVEVNPAFCRLVNYPREELIGRTPHELGIIPREVRDSLIELARSRNNELRDIEVRFRTREGEYRDAILSFSMVSIGKTPYRLVTAVDITSRKQAEAALRRNQRRLAKAQQLARLGTWSLEVSTGRIEWSTELYQIFGRDPDADLLSYDNLVSWVHADDRQRHDRYKADLLALCPGQQLPNLEYRLLRPNGEVRWVDCTSDVEFDQHDKPLRLYGTVIDTTDRKLAEENARNAAVAGARIDMLSKREGEVLTHVVAGCANKVIARRLEISEKTVEKHRSSLMKKLHVQSVAELVRLAMLAESAR